MLIDPLQAAQLAPQGVFGNVFGQFAQPVGQTVGGLLGNQQLGAQIGQLAGGLSRLVPFGTDPAVATYGGPQLTTLQEAVNLELQATNGFLQEATAGPIRKLYEYLEKNTQQHSQLANCVPVVRQAAEAFGARDYARAFTSVHQAYRCIAMLRASRPELPAL